MGKKHSLALNLDAVAQKAGVSTSTVSRVLNNLEIVKTSTRSRVLKATKELNYHPNLHARSLAGGKSRILGIIVSNMENPFFLDIYRTLGFDNIKLVEFCSPSLTTNHIPREQIGHIIFEHVVGNGRDEHDTGRGIVIDPELVLRDSTGPATAEVGY